MKYICNNNQCKNFTKETEVEKLTVFDCGILQGKSVCTTCKKQVDTDIDIKDTGWKKPFKDTGKNYYKKFKK